MQNFKIQVILKVNDSQFKDIKDSIDSGKKIKSITVKMEATHSGIVNGNNWYYTPDGMAKGASSFIKDSGAPVTIEHEKDSPVVGRVQQSKYVQTRRPTQIEDSLGRKGMDLVRATKKSLELSRKLGTTEGLGYIELIAKITDSDTINKVLDGEYVGVSVGGQTDSATCSICGTNQMEGSCGHSRGSFYDSEKCYYIGGNMEFDHVTYTKIPADKNARSTLIRDSEGVSTFMTILDYETIEDHLMKINEVSKSNDALVSYAQELGLKDYKVQDSEETAASDYVFSDSRVIPIATKEQASLALAFISDKLEDSKDKEGIVQVIKDKLEELGVKDHAEVIEEMKKELNVEEGKVQDFQPFGKEELVATIVDALTQHFDVQGNDYAHSRIKSLTQENRTLRQQNSEIQCQLRDSLIAQICDVAQISDSDKIDVLKKRTLASLQDKLSDARAEAAAKSQTKVEDSVKPEEKPVLEENSVSLDNQGEIKDSKSEEEVPEEKQTIKKDAVEILDAKQAEAKYKEIVRQDGFAAAHAWLAKGRADGSISENFLQH